ncbi:MAG TPA: hypothetical protein ENI33_06190 [Thermoplasmatales archaeon]|nr:hypothetical protein [Thermoplasmatales archaeon]
MINIGITERKISKMGSSLHVSLPSHWVKEHGLKAKESIIVIFNKALLVVPKHLGLRNDCLINELKNLIRAGAAHEQLMRVKYKNKDEGDIHPSHRGGGAYE